MKTRITELTGTRYPIVQGGMQWVGRAELASAVSNAAKAFARSLVKDRSPVSIALIRQMLYRNAQGSPWDAHLIESLAMFYTSRDDGREGVRAFNEKRAATFAGRASAMPPFFPWQDGPST